MTGAVDFNQFATGDRTYVYTGSAPVTEPPLSMFCWFRPDSLATSTRSLITIENGTNGHHHFTLSLEGTLFTQKVFAGKQQNSSVAKARAASTYTINAWQAAGGVWASTTSMTAYYNGVAGTVETDGEVPAGLDTTNIAVFVSLGAVVFDFHGCLAAAAIWNTALSDAEMLALYNGADPRTIQPAFLLVYLPMMTAATVNVDTQGGTWTANAGDGSFSDCASAPTITPIIPPLSGSGRRFLDELGPVRIVQ